MRFKSVYNYLELPKNTSGIYIIRNIKNSKFYIGSSKDIRTRIIRHMSDVRCNRHHCIHLQRAILRYGVDIFKFEYLECTDYINIEDNILKNLQNKETCYNTLYKSQSPPIKTKTVYKYSLSGKFIEKFNSIKDAAKSVNVNSTNICKAISKKGTSGGFQWRRYYCDKLDTTFMPYKILVLQDNILVYKADTISEISKKFNLVDWRISFYLSGKLNKYKNLHFVKEYYEI